MSDKSDAPLSFQLDAEHAEAIRKLAGKRSVRLMGRVESDRLHINFVACNAAFVACNAAFVACNAPFAKE
jgi:hypothetical protein